MKVSELEALLSDYPPDLEIRIEGYAINSEAHNHTYEITHVEGLQDGNGERTVVIWGSRDAAIKVEDVRRLGRATTWIEKETGSKIYVTDIRTTDGLEYVHWWGLSADRNGVTEIGEFASKLERFHESA